MNFKRIYLQSTVSKAFLDIDYFLMCFELRRSTWIGKYTNNDFVYSTFLNCIYDTLTLSCFISSVFYMSLLLFGTVIDIATVPDFDLVIVFVFVLLQLSMTLLFMSS